MAKVVMTDYKYAIAVSRNRLVFPECPYAGKDEKYESHDVHCTKADMGYCYTLHDMKRCPFDLEKSL